MPRLLQWFCLILINCSLLFVILNVFVWGYYKVDELRTKSHDADKTPLRYKKSNEALEKLFPKLTQHQINELISDSRRILQEYDSYTQFKEAPYKTRFVNVDSNGFRHSVNQGPWPPQRNDFVIFFFGGSTSFGYGVPDHETVSSHLQIILSQQLGIPVKVYNFGRAAYFSSQERILFQKLLVDGHVPDMAIFMDGVNEFALYDGEPGYTKQLKKFMQEADIPLSRKLLSELPLLKLVNHTMRPANNSGLGAVLEGADGAPETEMKLLAGVIRRYQRNRRIIEAISRDFGVASVFVWQPMPLYQYDLAHHIFRDFDYGKFTPHLKRGYEFVSSVSDYRENGHNFIWLADMQRDADRPLYVSAFHYGPEMSRFVANSIADTLMARNLIPANSSITPRVLSMSATQQPETSLATAER